MDRTYHTFALSDEPLIKHLLELSTKLGSTNSILNARLDDSGGHAIESTLDKFPDNPQVKSILAFKASLIGVAQLALGSPYDGCSVRVERAPNSGAMTIRANAPPRTDFAKASQLLANTQAVFVPYERNEAIDKLLGDELAEYYRKREQALLKLEEMSQRIIERNEEYRATIDRQSQAFAENLRTEYATKTKELEHAYQFKCEELQSRQKELETRQKELDDRSSTHARRQIRQDLKKAVADRNQKFTLTRETRSKRIVIHAVFVGTIALLAYAVGITLWRYSPTASGAIDWYTLVKLPCATIGTLLAIAWYIRWNDSWFRQHADEEFEIKRFELDIDRASWVVEMAMEWHAAKGTEIPPELLDRLTANLFAHKASDMPQHPSQDLASALIGATSEMSLNIPSFGEIKLDRKGTRKFGKSIEEDKS